MEGIAKGLLVLAVDLGAMMDFEALNRWQANAEGQRRQITTETSMESSSGSSPAPNDHDMGEFHPMGSGDWGRTRKSLGGFVVDLEGQGDAAKVSSLAHRFDEMMVFDEVMNT